MQLFCSCLVSNLAEIVVFLKSIFRYGFSVYTYISLYLSLFPSLQYDTSFSSVPLSHTSFSSWFPLLSSNCFSWTLAKSLIRALSRKPLAQISFSITTVYAALASSFAQSCSVVYYINCSNRSSFLLVFIFRWNRLSSSPVSKNLSRAYQLLSSDLPSSYVSSMIFLFVGFLIIFV